MSKSVANIPPGLGHCPPLGDPIPDEILHQAGVPSHTPGPGEPVTYQNTDNGAMYTWDGAAWSLVGGTGHDPVTVSDSPTVDLSLTGQVLSAAVKLSADAGNQAEARADGVYVPAPPAGHDPVTVSDSPTVDLSLTGQAVSANVKISSDTNNQVEDRADGLYVPPGAITGIQQSQSLLLSYIDGSELVGQVRVSPDAGNSLSTRINGLYVNVPGGHDPVTVLDSPTVDLSLTGQAVSAAVKLSGDAGNQMEARADGLYVPAAPVETVSDSFSIDLSIAANDLSAAVKNSTDPGNRLEVRADGLYVPETFVPDDYIQSVASGSAITLQVLGSTLGAEIKLSTDPGNAISIQGGGMYVPTPDAAPIQTVADSTNIDLALTGGELSASIILDPDLNNRLEARANGLFAGVPEAFNGLLRASFNYKLGGALTEDTVISGDAYNRGFTWSQLKHFIITANSLTLDPRGDMTLRTTNAGEIFIGSNTDLRLYGNTGVRVETPGVQATSVPVGAPLVLKNGATGLAEFGGMTRTVQIMILADDGDLEDGTEFKWNIPEQLSGYNLARAKFVVRNAHANLGAQVRMDIEKGGSSMLNTTCNLDPFVFTASTTDIDTTNDDVSEDQVLTFTFTHFGGLTAAPKGCTIELKFTV